MCSTSSGRGATAQHWTNSRRTLRSHVAVLIPRYLSSFTYLSSAPLLTYAGLVCFYLAQPESARGGSRQADKADETRALGGELGDEASEDGSYRGRSMSIEQGQCCACGWAAECEKGWRFELGAWTPNLPSEAAFCESGSPCRWREVTQTAPLGVNGLVPPDDTRWSLMSGWRLSLTGVPTRVRASSLWVTGPLGDLPQGEQVC